MDLINQLHREPRSCPLYKSMATISFLSIHNFCFITEALTNRMSFHKLKNKSSYLVYSNKQLMSCVMMQQQISLDAAQNKE